MFIVELMMINSILSFYCDADQYLPIRFFEAWMNLLQIQQIEMIQNFNGGARMKIIFIE